MDMIKGFSLIIPTYNTLEYLKLCLESIERYSKKEKNEILVYIDGSEDETKKYMEQYKSKYSIKWIYKDHTMSMAKGMNWGLDNAGNDYVLLLNDDTIFLPLWEEKLESKIKNNYITGYQLIGNKTLDIDSNLMLFNWDIFENKYNGFIHTYNSRKITGNSFTLTCFNKNEIGDIKFDENFKNGNSEDTDFFYQIYKGKPYITRCMYDDLLIYHWSSGGANQKIKKQIGEFSDEKPFINKWGKPPIHAAYEMINYYERKI